MYGPSYTVIFNKNDEYDIPYGYGSDGYLYDKAKFIGIIEHDNKKSYIVFKTIKDGSYRLCEPNIKLLGHKLEIFLSPISFGDTLESAIEGILKTNKFKWETFVSNTEEKDYPNLGKYNK